LILTVNYLKLRKKLDLQNNIELVVN